MNKLNLNSKLLKKINNVNINSFEELWSLNRKKLKDLNFTQDEINEIIVKLQLNGYDLNKRKTGK